MPGQRYYMAKVAGFQWLSERLGGATKRAIAISQWKF
jgi:hypothetical protein